MAIWHSILDGIGQILAFLYDLVPNYGVAIILLTIVIRVILLPLGIKQIRSMQAMQRVQPKVKALQQKHKGNRQKLNEEMMKLYREEGVNPLAGCLPLLAQLPILFALFAVLRFPQGLDHLPDSSRLKTDIGAEQADFIPGMNLLCNALEAGQTVRVPDAPEGAPDTKHCGSGIPARIPYYLLAFAMIGTTWYQQRQMQRASPPGAQGQQQAILKVMPLVFGIWGFFFPAGLVLYWTTTNGVQIGQQAYMLSRGHIGGAAVANGDRRRSDGQREDGKRDGTRTRSGAAGGASRERPTAVTRRRGASGQGQRRRGDGGGEADRGRDGGRGGSGQRERGSGGRHGGDRKKRRKR